MSRQRPPRSTLLRLVAAHVFVLVGLLPESRSAQAVEIRTVGSWSGGSALGGGSVVGAVVHGDNVYVVTSSSGLLIALDASDPAHIVELGAIETGVAWPWGVRVAQHPGELRAYVLSEPALTVNITDPGAMVVTHRWPTGFNYDIAVEPPVLYGLSVGIQAYDVSREDAPVELWSEEGPCTYLDWAWHGDRVFVTELTHCVHHEPETFAIDVFSQETGGLVPLGSIDTGYYVAQPLVASGDRLFAFFGARWKVYDVADASAPSAIGAGSTSRPVAAAAVDGNRLFYSDAPNCGSCTQFVHVVDVTDPGNPVEEASLGIPSMVSFVADGNRLYAWRHDGLDVLDVVDEARTPPPSFELSPGYPNPTRYSVTFELELPATGRARVDIYDVAGRRVRTLLDRVLPRGRQHTTWDGRDDRGALLPSGVYFYRLTAGGVSQTRKISLLR